MTGKILFLDDRWRSENWKESFDSCLPSSVEAIYEEYGHLAIQRIKENPDIKLVFLDLRFEGQSEQGEEILNKIKENFPDLKVIILTSISDVQLALRLVHDQKKAYYYLYKDEIDLDQLKTLIENAIESYDLLAETIRSTDLGIIIGESPALKKVLSLATRASKVNSHVLITGESGTGKELIARAIHYNSRRKTHSLIIVNCASFNKEQIENELFGHERGSYTDATKTTKGRFELANGGTLFLDEVAELSIESQAKLLRVLQFGEFEKIGGENTIKVDVRLIAATNKDLREEIEKGTFRDDLYYRLNVIRIHVPPLRERKEDIPILAKYLLPHLSEKIEVEQIKEFSDNAIEELKKYSWEKGNIRGLENTIERAIALCSSEIITAKDIADSISLESTKPLDHNTVDNWIKKVLLGSSSWKEITNEFAPSGETTKKIIEGVIVALKEQHESGSVGSRLTKLLGVTRNYLGQILLNLNLRLRDY